MVVEPVCCPYCGSHSVGRHGQTKDGRKRYVCQKMSARKQLLCVTIAIKPTNPASKRPFLT